MEAHEKDLQSVAECDEQWRAVQMDYRMAGLSPREIALLDFAVKFTRSPSGVRNDDLEALRGHDLTDEQIVMPSTASATSTSSTEFWTALGSILKPPCATARRSFERLSPLGHHRVFNLALGAAARDDASPRRGFPAVPASF